MGTIVASVTSALEVRQVHAGLSHNLVAHITGTLEVGPNGVRSSLATGLGQAQLVELTHEEVRRGRTVSRCASHPQACSAASRLRGRQSPLVDEPLGKDRPAARKQSEARVLNLTNSKCLWRSSIRGQER